MLMSLGPDAAEGVSLKDLFDEPELPKITMGPERYQVLKTLGQGGMGKVVLAYDRDLKRRRDSPRRSPDDRLTTGPAL